MVVEISSCLLSPFQIWFGFAMQMRCAWISELACNPMVGASRAPSRDKIRGTKVAHRSNPASAAPLAEHSGWCAYSARVLFHKPAS